MWVLIVTLCRVLISRRSLIWQPWLYSSLSKCVILCGFTEKNVLLNFLFWPCKTADESWFYKNKKNQERATSWCRCLVFITKADSAESPGETCQCWFPPWLCYSHHTACLEPGNQSADLGLYCMKECLYGTVDTCQLQGPHILRKSSLSKDHLPGFIFQYRWTNWGW